MKPARNRFLSTWQKQFEMEKIRKLRDQLKFDLLSIIVDFGMMVSAGVEERCPLACNPVLGSSPTAQ